MSDSQYVEAAAHEINDLRAQWTEAAREIDRLRSLEVSLRAENIITENERCFAENEMAKLKAEVGRLRADADKAEIERDEYKRAHSVVFDDCEMRAREYAKLEAENAELRAAGKGLCSNCGFACSIIDETEVLKTGLAKLEAENAELQNNDTLVSAFKAIRD